jgi:hypothetical protein
MFVHSDFSNFGFVQTIIFFKNMLFNYQLQLYA